MEPYILFGVLFAIFALLTWITDSFKLLLLSVCFAILSSVSYNPDDIYFPNEQQLASVDDDKLIKEYRLLILDELPSGTYTSIAFNTPLKTIDEDMQANISSTWTFNSQEKTLHLTRHALITSKGEDVLNDTFDIKVDYSIDGAVLTFGDHEGNSGLIQREGYPMKGLGNNIFLITYFNDSGTLIKEMLSPITLNDTGDSVTIN